MEFHYEATTMRKSSALVIVLIVGMAFMFGSQNYGVNVFPGVRDAYAQDNWKVEFDDVCSKTQDAMAFSPGELRTLIDRCDRLKAQIEKLEETQRKVYLKRLQLCRDLFFFVLESKEKK